jgi:hypothetical protein
MPRYLVVPESVIAKWGIEGTTVVEGTVNGTPMGRRGLKRWDDERRLHLNYLSECVLVDRDCLISEGDRLWKRIEPLAEREGATTVAILAEDCWHEEEEVTYAKIRGNWVRLRN